MTSNQRNVATIGTTLVLTGVGMLVYLQAAGYSAESLIYLLRLTARLAFIAFFVVFIARPLRDLVKTDLTRKILANRRQIGLVTGTLMCVHLGLIAYRFGSSPEINLEASAIFGGIAYAMIIVMIITSFDAMVRALGPANWRRLHKAGIYIVAIPFVSTLLPGTREQLFETGYIGFTLLIAVAMFIRLFAFLKTRSRKA
jgi:DMSO/TMAO reductase YedYZ heme-binding membrane subunit